MQDPVSTLREIQKEYFKLLNDCAPDEWKELAHTDLDVVEAATSLYSSMPKQLLVPGLDGSYRAAFDHKLDTIVKELSDFWQTNYSMVHEALRELDALTLNLALGIPFGEIWGTIHRCGLYFDTICLCDPIMVAPGTWPIYLERATSLYKRTILFPACLAILRMAPLALAGCSPPMLVIYPRVHTMCKLPGTSPDREVARRLMMEFYADIFGIQFDFHEFDLHEQGDLWKAIGSIRDDLLLKLIRNNSLLEKLHKISGESFPDSDELLWSDKERDMVALARNNVRSQAGRLLINTQALVRDVFQEGFGADYECASLGCDRIIYSGLLWDLHMWNLKRDSKLAARYLRLSEEDAVLHSLELQCLRWLGNIPTGDLIRLRQEGYMEQMRNLFRVTRRELYRRNRSETFGV